MIRHVKLAYDLLMLDTSNDPSKVKTYAGLYKIGDKACYMATHCHTTKIAILVMERSIYV